MAERPDNGALAIEALQAFAGDSDFHGWHSRYAGAIAKARVALGGVSGESPAAIDAHYLDCVERELRDASAELDSLRRAVSESDQAAAITARAAEIQEQVYG